MFSFAPPIFGNTGESGPTYYFSVSKTALNAFVSLIFWANFRPVQKTSWHVAYGLTTYCIPFSFEEICLFFLNIFKSLIHKKKTFSKDWKKTFSKLNFSPPSGNNTSGLTSLSVNYYETKVYKKKNRTY